MRKSLRSLVVAGTAVLIALGASAVMAGTAHADGRGNGPIYCCYL
jgi:hypothetical protein